MLDSFVPSKLSVKQVVSKVASVFDLRGLLAPVLASLRLDTRRQWVPGMRQCQLI